MTSAEMEAILALLMSMHARFPHPGHGIDCYHYLTGCLDTGLLLQRVAPTQEQQRILHTYLLQLTDEQNDEE